MSNVHANHAFGSWRMLHSLRKQLTLQQVANTFTKQTTWAGKTRLITYKNHDAYICSVHPNVWASSTKANPNLLHSHCGFYFYVFEIYFKLFSFVTVSCFHL